MRLLVIGGGGREHALAWRLAKSEDVSKVFVAPGNAGTAREPLLENISLTDLQELADFAAREQIHATIVGPEAPLAAGVVDLFRERGLRIFGPTKAAAQLESSKDFAKRFMTRHGIPTAAFQTFSDIAAAHAYVNQVGAPIVIKADGLAAGKGVVVAMSLAEAHAAIDAMLADNKLGDAGARVVVEEFLDGEEASFIVMVDGKTALAMATSQDHKRLLDADEGPNTGGMGAYSPAPVVSPEIHGRVMREVINPTIAGMAKDGIVFTGFLYAGLMIKPDGSLRVLEYNCRFGDPETQPIMMRLKSDFLALIDAGIDGRLHEVEAQWDRRVALGVVMAAANYPETPRKGDVIRGLPAEGNAPGGDTHVFHAGTAEQNGEVVTAGGRVLCVTALGENVKQAQSAAYGALNQIQFDGMQCRRDIGYRALAR
ncbi:MAG: phosphoribosylamine--glycine ligase [Rhodocyclaceae bacterium]|jgi:phosphoribosylamine--glycine ligase|nr:phosphoribosylamine--glycine ligase [Rhodocyclaceae bacterium]MBK6908030.1 phosphoribosylamine--glycine ligase [Rhodocyclaceae bacterium]